MVCLAITMLLMGTGIPWDRPLEDWLLLAASGVLGIALADTLFFAALKRMGPGRLAVVECAYTPFIVRPPFFFWENLCHRPFIVGASGVFLGVLLASLEKGEASAMEGEPSEIRKGIVFGVVAVGTMAVGIVIVKPVLERSELIEATQMRLVFGTLALFIWGGLRDKLSEITDALRPGKHFRVMLPGAFLGSYLAMILWVGGMKYALASVSGS